VPYPLWVGRLDRLGTDTLARLCHRLLAAEVEDEERLRVQRGRFVQATPRELEVRACSWDPWGALIRSSCKSNSSIYAA